MKRCSICGVEKDLNDFYKSGHTTSGRQSSCKECARVKNKERYEKNKSKSKSKRKSKSKSKPVDEDKNYISNKELYYEIMVSKARGRLTRKASDMLILLCERINRRFYYKNPDDRQDTLQGSMEIVFKNWMGFDEERTNNPFSYFSEVSKRSHAVAFNEIHKLKGTSDTYKPVQYRFSQFDNEKGESHGMFI